MKNEKVSKTVREKRFWGNSNRNQLRMSVRTILDHQILFEKKYFCWGGSRPLREHELPYLNWSQRSPDDSGKKYFSTIFNFSSGPSLSFLLQEEDLLLVQEEDLLLAQEEDLLLAKEKIERGHWKSWRWSKNTFFQNHPGTFGINLGRAARAPEGV